MFLGVTEIRHGVFNRNDSIADTIQISAAPKNSTYAVLDMQGRVLLSGRVESVNFNIAVPNTGSYLVRVGNATRKVQVK
ncbi:MAG: T9SS type A sorting domain-containing protein [Fibrobacter sp.]|nr:T9SS type A sorting domain-containing protein [Fibrobacter sp.]